MVTTFNQNWLVSPFRIPQSRKVFLWGGNFHSAVSIAQKTIWKVLLNCDFLPNYAGWKWPTCQCNETTFSLPTLHAICNSPTRNLLILNIGMSQPVASSSGHKKMTTPKSLDLFERDFPEASGLQWCFLNLMFSFYKYNVSNFRYHANKWFVKNVCGGLFRVV